LRKVGLLYFPLYFIKSQVGTFHFIANGMNFSLHQRCAVVTTVGRKTGIPKLRDGGPSDSEPMGLENTILISPSLGLFPHLFERKSSRSSTMLKFSFFKL